jgi:hypothetical protein
MSPIGILFLIKGVGIGALTFTGEFPIELFAQLN